MPDEPASDNGSAPHERDDSAPPERDASAASERDESAAPERDGSAASDTAREIRVTLRLPADLHAALRDLAQRDDRSLNREIVALLRAAATPTPDAEAQAESRRKLFTGLVRYSFPRPTTRKPRGGG